MLTVGIILGMFVLVYLSFQFGKLSGIAKTIMMLKALGVDTEETYERLKKLVGEVDKKG